MFVQGGVDPHRIVVIPEPVDVDFFSPEHAAKLDAAAAARAGSGAPSAPRSLFVYPGETPGAPRPFRFLSIFKVSFLCVALLRSTGLGSVLRLPPSICAL